MFSLFSLLLQKVIFIYKTIDDYDTYSCLRGLRVCQSSEIRGIIALSIYTMF